MEVIKYVMCIVILIDQHLVLTIPVSSTSSGNDSKSEPKKEVFMDEMPTLENMKRIGSFSVVKSHAKIYTNINGNEKEVAHTKEEVNKDGNVLAKVEQRIDKTGEDGQPIIITSLDIPSQNVHKVIQKVPNDNKIDLERKGPPGLNYSPMEMADYIFWTGDEKSVTSAIEEYLQQGILSKTDAIDYLQEIKRNLELIQSQHPDRGNDIQKVVK